MRLPLARLAVVAAVAGVVLAATIALAGCSSPLPVRTVRLGGEAWIVYEDDGDGMRNRAGFGDADGMLFDMGRDVEPSGVPFGMEHVSFPIDIAWFDGNGALVNSTTMAACDPAPCPLYYADGPYRWAVEAPAGAFADLRPSDQLEVGD